MIDLLEGAPSPFDEALGLRVVDVLDDHVVLRLDPPAAVVGGVDPRPSIHGGAIAALVDTAGWAAVQHASPGQWVSTDLRCDFLRAAELAPHRVTARCLRVGRTLAVVDVVIAPWDEPDQLVAAGRIQLMRIAPS